MNAAKHVLFVNEFYHPDICATAVVLTDRLRRLAELRPDVRFTIIAGNRAWDNPECMYPAEDSHEGVRIVRVSRPAVSRKSLLRRALGFAAFQRGAVRAARGLGRIDLVIGTTAPPQGGEIARRIVRSRGCPYVYYVFDLYPDLAATLGRIRHGGFIHRRWHARDARAMRDAAAVVAVGERIAQRIAETRGVPQSKLRTIHDGFDASKLAPAARNDFRSRYNPDGRFVVQYAGNMGLSHPFDTILAAAGKLADDPEILFQLIGDGPQRPWVQRNLPANAQLIDYQPADRLGEVLATADVCLISQHPGMYDKSLPYKVYTNLAAGKPAIFIGNSRSEIAAWFEETGAGQHVNQGGVEDLVDVIRGFKSDPSRVERSGRAARALFDDKFRSERAAQQWAELIDELV